MTDPLRIRPLKGKLLCAPIRHDKQGMIHLTERMKFSMELSGVREWRVLRVPRLDSLDPGIVPGDRVITHSFTEGPIELEGGMAIITLSQVLAILPWQPDTRNDYLGSKERTSSPERFGPGWRGGKGFGSYPDAPQS